MSLVWLGVKTRLHTGSVMSLSLSLSVSDKKLCLAFWFLGVSVIEREKRNKANVERESERIDSDTFPEKDN